MERLFHTTDCFGVTRIQPDRGDLEDTLETLKDADYAEHPDVAFVLDEETQLIYSNSGVLILERGEEDLRIMKDVSIEFVLETWLRIIREGPGRWLDRLGWQRLEED